MMPRFEWTGTHTFIMHAEHETDRPILAAIAGSRRTLLMDAGNSPAHARLFREELKRQGIRLPELLVLTHWHWDHTFGMAEWGIPAAAHGKTGEALKVLAEVAWSEESLEGLIGQGFASESTVRNIRKEYGGRYEEIRVAEPEVLFEEGLTIDLGGVRCRIERVESDHSPDSCFLYVEEDRILFTGDALGPSVYGGPRRYTPERFLRLLEQVKSYGAELVVESHGHPMDKESFALDVKPWEELARIASSMPGAERGQVAEALRLALGCKELAPDLEKSVEFFVQGRS